MTHQNSYEVSQVLAQGARDDLINYALTVQEPFEVNWHHELIADRLMQVESGLGMKKGLKKIMIAMPPQISNKSTLVNLFAAWIMGKQPQTRILAGSYNIKQSNAQSDIVMNYVNSQSHQDIFGSKIHPRKRAVGRWGTTGHKDGSYTTFSMKAGFSGKPSECFVSGTKIQTKKGIKNIEDCNVGESVLSYNHERNYSEYKKIVATKRVVKESFRKVALSNGDSFLCTPEHRIFIVGRGYTETKDIQAGDRVLSSIQNNKKRSSNMLSLWGRIREGMGRIYKASSSWARNILLWNRMQEDRVTFKVWEKVCQGRVFKLHKKEWSTILLKKVQTFNGSVKGNRMSLLSDVFSTFIAHVNLLFNGLQKQFALIPNEREGKLKLATWEWNEYVPKSFLSSKKRDIEKRQGLSGMSFKEKISSASQGLQSYEQFKKESHYSMCNLPHEASSVKEVEVSSITTIDDKQYAYDIHVADNNNFFANTTLVHNCNIIDDPFAGTKDSAVKAYRDAAWKTFKIDLTQRLLPMRGATVLIFTRWVLDDIIGRLEREFLEEGKKLTDEWEVLILPAIADKDYSFTLSDGREVGYKKGESLWESRFPVHPDLMERKSKMSAVAWAAQYMQNPISGETQQFKKEDFREITMAEVEKKKWIRFLAIDPSSGMSDDYTGFADVRIDSATGHWYVNAWNEKLQTGQLADKIIQLNMTNFYHATGIEDSLYSKAFMHTLETTMDDNRVAFPLFTLKGGNKSKEDRVFSLQPFYKKHKIFHITGKCAKLEEELLVFPAGINDDVVDALSYVEQLINLSEVSMYASDELEATVPEITSYA